MIVQEESSVQVAVGGTVNIGALLLSFTVKVHVCESVNSPSEISTFTEYVPAEV